MRSVAGVVLQRESEIGAIQMVRTAKPVSVIWLFREREREREREKERENVLIPPLSNSLREYLNLKSGLSKS